MTLWKWSKTAADNDDADVSINLRENQAPSTYNNAVRAAMAAIAKYRDDISGNLVLGGSLTAYTATTNQVLDALTDGFTFYARANVTNGLNPTLAVDGLTAKAIQSRSGVAIGYGAVIKDAIYKFTYDSSADAWLVANAPGASRLIGETIEFNGTTLPPLTLWEDGSAVSRTTYAVLFAVIGTTFGVGDGSTTFNVPDSRGRVSAGQDDMGGTSANRLTAPGTTVGGIDGDTLGAVGGEETHTPTEAEMFAHTHTATVTDPGHTHSSLMGAQQTMQVDEPDVTGRLSGSTATGSATTGITVANSSKGSSTAHNNVQPTIIKNKCIFAGA